jgi:folate-binding protein YgfZ
VSAPAATAPLVRTGYALMRAGEPAVARGRACLVWVEGPDAASFLHGLLSNDVEGLAPGQARAALFLDAKGHIQVDVRVRRDSEDAFTLVAPAALGDRLAELLERYHFSEDLDVIGPEEVDLLSATGVPAEAAGPAQLVLAGAIPGTLDLVVDDADAAIAALGAPEVPAEALEMLRVAAGVPAVGIDTGPSTLVQEVGLQDDAVSFDKGCYLGQETVARVRYRGRVNRLLRGLALGGPVAAGAAVSADGREVGRVTSVAVTPDLGAVGLAVLRHEVAPGAAVHVEGAAEPARVVTLPFPPP